MLRAVSIAFIAVRAIQLVFAWPVSCPSGDICNLAGKDVQIEGRIVSIPSERLERTIVNVETNSYTPLRKSKIQVILPHTQYNLLYGDLLLLSGQLKIPEEDPEKNFSYPLYLAGKGVHSTMFNPHVEKISGNNDSQTLAVIVYAFREKIRETVNKYLVEPRAAVVNAMIIGDQGMIGVDLRDKYSKIGVVHILSVSGAHVTLVTVIIIYLVSRITFQKTAIFIAVFFGVLAYLLISGSPDCAIRAGIMGILTFLALQNGKLANVKNLFWLSGAVLLCFNPLDLISDIGFQLSYLAVFGMIYLFPSLDKTICWGRMGWRWKICRILLVSLAISLAVAPLVFYYFGTLSLVSPVANLTLLPFFSVLLPLGFILVGIGLLAEWWGSFSLLVKIMAYLTSILFEAIDNIAAMLVKIPASYVTGEIKIGWMLLFYVAFLVLVILFGYVVGNYIIPCRLEYFRSEEYLSLSNDCVKTHRNAFIRNIIRKLDRKNLQVSFVIWLLILGCLSFVSLNYLYSSNRPTRLVMFNVGQGDALLLDWPKYHFQILIDGGPGRRILPELGETLPFYDKNIEIVVLSHPHQDHLEGLIAALERYGVSKIYLPSLPQKDSSELYRILWNKLREKEVVTAVAKRGQKMSFSAVDGRITELEFLTPFFDYSNGKIRDVNDQSAILKISYPKSILFMGDSSSKVERALLAEESHNIKVEMLKIGHHGSRFSSSDVFLDTVKPRIAFISVGKNNLFGHPAPATLKKLEKRNIRVYRTDLDGRTEIKLIE